MKTALKILYISSILFFFSFRSAAQSSDVMYDPGNLSGSLELNTDDYGDDVYYEWEINTNSNKPLKISYTTGTEYECDYLYIYAKDNYGNYTFVTAVSGYQSGTISTLIPSGKALIVFVSDGSYNYFDDDSLFGFNLSFSQDNSYLVNSDMSVSGDTYINGKLGIGTSNALEKLHVNGAIRGGYDGGALQVRTNYGSVFIGPQNGADWAHFYTDKSKFIFNKPVYTITGEFTSYAGVNLSLQTYGTTRMTILNSNGNVGIGTTTPYSNLHVKGKQIIGSGPQTSIFGNSSLQIQENANVETSLRLWQNGVANTVLGSKPNDTKFYITNDYYGSGLGVANHSITLDINGNVGIGTNSPQNMLDVKGTIRAIEVKVESVDKFADFVFEKTYRLPKLSEVNSFIQTNGHLPNIPSATEVKENGMSLVDMQVKLLQKVEELTLYVIEQQKRIEILEKNQK